MLAVDLNFIVAQEFRDESNHTIKAVLLIAGLGPPHREIPPGLPQKGH
jgi:hypothetical protein